MREAMPRYLAALVLLAASQAGCRPAAEPYMADVAIVHQIGTEQALAKLSEALKQVAAPEIDPDTVVASLEFYSYRKPSYYAKQARSSSAKSRYPASSSPAAPALKQIY